MVIEILRFRLAAGVDEEVFLRADHDVQTRCYPRHSGFLRRTTARGDDGGWVVIVLWASADAAADSLALAADHPVAAAFTALLDPATMMQARYATLD